jgi:hypothetical protein
LIRAIFNGRVNPKHYKKDAFLAHTQPGRIYLESLEELIAKKLNGGYFCTNFDGDVRIAATDDQLAEARFFSITRSSANLLRRIDKRDLAAHQEYFGSECRRVLTLPLLNLKPIEIITLPKPSLHSPKL